MQAVGGRSPDTTGAHGHGTGERREMYPITVEANPAAAAAELDSRLRQFNEEQIGPRNTLEFVLSARDDKSGLVAGLVGETLWNALLVSVLWVHERHRKNGYGTALIERAERIGHEHGCEVVFLNTMTFQAPGFYSKLGYQVFGELLDAPRGHSRLWFCKRLPPKP
jgi:GNAT superfamily N-acetyltransferase